MGFAWFDQARPAGAPGVIALEMAFSEKAFQRIIEQWGAEGVRAYQISTLYIDYWFPVAYAVLLSSLIAILTVEPRRSPGSLQLTCFALPLIAGLLDWVENTLHLILLRDPSQLSAPLVLLASIAAAVKLSLIGVSILVVLYITLNKTRGRLTRMSDPID